MVGGIQLKSISDIIEQYIKQILKESASGSIDIQRSDLAMRFQCVPSQINYVISTRFTVEKGYVVESKRGGGGYIRIRKVDLDSTASAVKLITELLGSQITQREAEGIIYRLLNENLITKREARMMEAAVSKEVIPYYHPDGDRLRAALLRSMLLVILKG